MDTFDQLFNELKAAGVIGYQMKPEHREVCGNIWRTQVPAQGQSEYLQGELVRQVEAMRYESVRNKNARWDDSYSWFCKHIYDVIADAKIVPEDRLAVLKTELDFLKYCGQHKQAYQGFDVFDHISSYVAEFCIAHPERIPYEKKSSVPQ